MFIAQLNVHEKGTKRSGSLNMKAETGIIAFGIGAMMLYLVILGFIGWVIIKLLQHFSVI